MTTRTLRASAQKLPELLRAALPPNIFCGIATTEDIAFLETTLALGPAEKVALSRRTSEITKMQFRLGRLAARRALEAAGVPDAAIEIASTKDGAPQFASPFSGSIAHTEYGELACAIALVTLTATQNDLKSIGVDLEPVNRKPHPGLLARITSDEKIEGWATQNDAATLTLFSVKESIYKCLHPIVKKWFGFKAAVVSEPRNREILAVITEDLSPAVLRSTPIECGRLLAEGFVVTWAMWR